MNALRLLGPLLAVTLLAGCAAAPAVTRATVAPVDTVEHNALEPVVLEAGTVVATGSLTSVDGLTTGDVAVTAVGSGEFGLVISNYSSPVHADTIADLSAKPFTEEAYCANGFMTLSLGNLTLGPTITSDINFTEITLGNPDFLDTLVLTLNDGNAPRTGCFYPVVASAPLTWTMPDLRPDIRVFDNGSTGGATGDVTTERGIPVSYRVASGDVMAEIAARFGISVADVFYLNPAREPASQDPVAYTSEVLNLDKAGR